MNSYLNRAGGAASPATVRWRWRGWATPCDPPTCPACPRKAELAQLDESSGLEADDLFTHLMIRHHAGGIAMAEYAAEHGEHAGVRDLAAHHGEGAAHRDQRDERPPGRARPRPDPAVGDQEARDRPLIVIPRARADRHGLGRSVPSARSTIVRSTAVRNTTSTGSSVRTTSRCSGPSK